MTTRGLRRGEACGVRWEDSDLIVSKTLMVLEADDEDDDGLKSDSNWRTVAAGGKNGSLLTEWGLQQKRERLAAGPAWVDTGLVFTAANGSALREEYVSEHVTATPSARPKAFRRSVSMICGTALPQSCWGPVSMGDLDPGWAVNPNRTSNSGGWRVRDSPIWTNVPPRSAWNALVRQ
ncbi:hypothetical protein [Nonomuraea jabiensis]|uniref:hypothetical protein n=1 Tax=Nonomuraea jabiensis TaxID=882448 RepID=UPI0036CB9739